jgi:hypothetical protein
MAGLGEDGCAVTRYGTGFDGEAAAAIGAGAVCRSSRVISVPCLGDWGLMMFPISRPPPMPATIATMTVPAPAK